MVVVLELRAVYPLLVVECQLHLNWLGLDLNEFFFGDFVTAPQPRKRWNDALEALNLAIPLCSDLAGPFFTAELQPLDIGVIDSPSRDVDAGTSLRLGKWWIYLLESQIIVPEDQWFSRELLAVQGNVDVVLKSAIWVVLAWGQRWHLAHYFAVLVNSVRTGVV
jgi:hypothetical protein